MKLSIVAISYNEAEHLKEWYEMHKDLADEIILVDTGSFDNTIAIAKTLPIKLYQMKWKHNFAEAKNYAVRCATGDWILLQSPDFYIFKEDFSKVREAIESEKYVGYFMPTYHHFQNWFGEKGFWDIKDLPMDQPNRHIYGNFCLFKNTPEIQYRERCHEQAHESALEAFGSDKLGVLEVIRHHDNEGDVINKEKKKAYYDFLEQMGRNEREVIWKEAEKLRTDAYVEELAIADKKKTHGERERPVSN
jgi:glycosyltransferase involved in cell wall biosynthesis